MKHHKSCSILCIRCSFFSFHLMNALVYFDMDHRNIKSRELKNDKKNYMMCFSSTWNVLASFEAFLSGTFSLSSNLFFLKGEHQLVCVYCLRAQPLETVYLAVCLLWNLGKKTRNFSSYTKRLSFLEPFSIIIIIEALS